MHGPHIVGRPAPVAPDVQIAQLDRGLPARLDRLHPLNDLLGHEPLGPEWNSWLARMPVQANMP